MVGSAQESRKTHREHLGLLKNYFAWLQATMNLVHQKGTQRLQLKRKKNPDGQITIPNKTQEYEADILHNQNQINPKLKKKIRF